MLNITQCFHTLLLAVHFLNFQRIYTYFVPFTSLTQAFCVEYETISPKEPITDDSKSFTFHFMMRHANDWTALSELAMNLAVSYEKHDGTQWNGVDTKDTAIVVNNLLSNMWQEIVIRLNQVYYVWYN